MIEITVDNIELTDRESPEEKTTPVGDEKLKIRKQCELRIISKYDRTAVLLGKDFWYIIDSNWLNAWSRFVNGGDDEPAPGPLSGKDLLDDHGEPLPGLKPRIDYRGVSPLVYYIFVELHGKDPNVPDICRYNIDIYKNPVPVEKIVDVSFRALHKAKVKVNKIRPEWMEWDRPDDDEEEEPQGCCGLSKEHIEAIIYWMITCCRRKQSGRGDISYRDYRPLKNNLDDDDEAGESKEGEEIDEEGAPKQKKKSRLGNVASVISSAPRVIFNKIRNNLTIQQEKKEKEQAAKGNFRTKKQSRMARQEHRDDLVDESDGDYEGMGWSRADRDHEKGTWLGASVSSSIHGANRV